MAENGIFRRPSSKPPESETVNRQVKDAENPAIFQKIRKLGCSFAIGRAHAQAHDELDDSNITECHWKWPKKPSFFKKLGFFPFDKYLKIYGQAVYRTKKMIEEGNPAFSRSWGFRLFGKKPGFPPFATFCPVHRWPGT